MNEIYTAQNDYRNYLSHHGILGMKWGKRNGPPYPLGASDHSASEKKAGWRQSLSQEKRDKLLNVVGQDGIISKTTISRNKRGNRYTAQTITYNPQTRESRKGRKIKYIVKNKDHSTTYDPKNKQSPIYTEPNSERTKKLIKTSIVVDKNTNQRIMKIREYNINTKQTTYYTIPLAGIKMNDYRNYLQHSAKGTTWKEHKYIRKEGNRYIYPEDVKGAVKDKTVSVAKEEVSKRIDTSGVKAYPSNIYSSTAALDEETVARRMREYDKKKAQDAKLASAVSKAIDTGKKAVDTLLRLYKLRYGIK